MTTDVKTQPVPVHVANAAEIGTGQRPRKHVRAVYRTYVLTAANPLVPILAEDLSRMDTWLMAYGNSVVVCESQSQAQDPANQVAGTGVFANTPANPQGTLLYVPSGAAFTTPVSPSASDWLTIHTTETAWATALAFPAYLAVVTHNRAEGY